MTLMADYACCNRTIKKSIWIIREGGQIIGWNYKTSL